MSIASPRLVDAAALGLAASLAACSVVLDWSALQKNGVGASGGGGAHAGGGGSHQGGSGVGGRGGDANDAGPRCDLHKPFGAPVVLPGPIDMPSSNETDGRLTPDELELYFAHDQGNGKPDLYVATRKKASDPFDAPQAIGELASGGSDTSPFLMSDRTTLYFASDRVMQDRSKIYVAKRPTPTGIFGAPVLVDALNVVSASVEAPFFLPDGATVYFGDGYDGILMTAHASMGSFTAPVAVPGLETTNAFYPVVTGDDLTIFFEAAASGKDSIWSASRATPKDPFTNAKVVSELNISPDRNAPTWVSTDGCRIVLQASLSGSMNLYLAARP